MPWIQFFDEEANLIREFECSRGAKIMMDQGGTLVLDEAARDTPTNPRVILMRNEQYSFAKTISDSERDKLRGETPLVDETGARMTVERIQSEGPPTEGPPTLGQLGKRAFGGR